MSINMENDMDNEAETIGAELKYLINKRTTKRIVYYSSIESVSVITVPISINPTSGISKSKRQTSGEYPKLFGDIDSISLSFEQEEDNDYFIGVSACSL
ncbi:predicted protein [Sclerotinia sclerotiorum 1980 UF-70]|uniref:Uncharacterized protein n=1 Tax=Sclerotinia sclerotiorum (strain ATCC 18683 / 1980 / Ss-1) TaxID=665079 RepID=A7EVR9_SCLS1|nr:predicted protein [Sclerotinia sclerotiorum 1980 UF-70]EDN93561.1 predicted protein [Sclerotinia sclerotiorum 1980 UF-70]